ncbi:hypothetical protein WALSEDRAFT_57744 [Wallemia mellicola CBS 633.66]|uniref:WIBG Mago-binding domain-containing protein n=2 Tax=Wallemia mellicola TaxID=1708541 RepID=I4YB25_WALMC|nr:hypothetical protein WALSEDRAFT_57744 [Wallemia mellicola CBS 633.66]TIB76729.1 hypothetical protein E3Q23_01669 [Wallemia mellicola]EIM21167.1 hypothetical protein WALSEDRAFT_57744 [Wallemia mellicola CBS 633.66]TIC17687.1 hypothetical protein E3Q15_00462 [Wallemia mellicola]TIC31646.1 hypothetical protein E3Q11_00624 [Wallemia mellicola]TIC58973.1 hypothetical protein E3Q05_00511 [Wallemia mellicola]|eukprot:XP_006958840.1 hypothetical protein WALSEDRAFT_57744 [Wallemia mellicola CBS 633.66]
MTTTPRSTPVVSAAGIVDREDGERAIPQSVRADGSVRKERKVRPGFQPVEDIQRYKPPQSRYRSPGSLPSSPRQLDKNTIAGQQETDKKTIIQGLESLISENKPEKKTEKKTEKKDDAILQQPADTDIIAQKDKQDTTKEEDELTSKLADMQLGSMASVYATADPNERVEEQPQVHRGRGRGRSRGRPRGTRGRKP